MPGRRDRPEPPVRLPGRRGQRPAGPGRPARRAPAAQDPGTGVAATRTRYLVGAGARRIGAASRAGGANESGLTRLIWTHCGTTRRTR